MAQNGFLIRGTLRPAMGSVPQAPQNLSALRKGKVKRGPSVAPSPNNRIPPSMSLHKANGRV